MKPVETILKTIWLVVYLSLWKMSSLVGMMTFIDIPNIWKNGKCSKPPTSHSLSFVANYCKCRSFRVNGSYWVRDLFTSPILNLFRPKLSFEACPLWGQLIPKRLLLRGMCRKDGQTWRWSENRWKLVESSMFNSPVKTRWGIYQPDTFLLKCPPQWC